MPLLCSCIQGNMLIYSLSTYLLSTYYRSRTINHKGLNTWSLGVYISRHGIKERYVFLSLIFPNTSNLLPSSLLKIGLLSWTQFHAIKRCCFISWEPEEWLASLVNRQYAHSQNMTWACLTLLSCSLTSKQTPLCIFSFPYLFSSFFFLQSSY
jgi:hypothetical protein